MCRLSSCNLVIPITKMRKTKLKLGSTYLSMHKILVKNANLHYSQTLMQPHTVPPTFATQPQVILDVTEWTEVVLNCSASGTPMPTIRWEREGGSQLPVGAVPSEPITNGNIVRRIYPFLIVIMFIFFIFTHVGH